MNMFLGMGERLAASVLTSCTIVEYTKNQSIMSTGEMPAGMVVLKSGLAGVYAGSPGWEVLIAPLIPGVFCGTRIERRSPGRVTIKALANSRVLHLSEERFLEFCQIPEFSEWCSANQYRNISILSNISAAAVQKNTDRKIIAFVHTYLELVLGRMPGEKETAEWLITQSHLSDILGITRTHLNARLSALARDGSIDIRRRQIVWSSKALAAV